MEHWQDIHKHSGNIPIFNILGTLFGNIPGISQGTFPHIPGIYYGNVPRIFHEHIFAWWVLNIKVIVTKIKHYQLKNILMKLDHIEIYYK